MFFVKKRKKESVAIPFLISMLLSMAIIGIPVSKLYAHLIDNKTASDKKEEQSVFSPTEKNNITTLLVFDVDDAALRDSFVIMRTSATNSRFIFVPVSNDILYTSGKTKTKMSDIYKKEGIIELKKAVEDTFDIKMDRYMTLNNEAATLVFDILGGVNYNVPDGLKGLNEGTQYLSSDFIIKLVSNKKFAEDARNVTIGSLLSEMFIQTSGGRVVDALDYTFEKLINIVKTDITSIDYKDQKKALEYILENNQFEATYRVPTGKKTDDGLIVEDDFIEDMKEVFGL